MAKKTFDDKLNFIKTIEGVLIDLTDEGIDIKSISANTIDLEFYNNIESIYFLFNKLKSIRVKLEEVGYLLVGIDVHKDPHRKMILKIQKTKS